MHYNVKEMAPRFALFESDMKQSSGFQVKEASYVINHVLLAKQIKLQYSALMWVFLILRSLGVERHITNIYCAKIYGTGCIHAKKY